MKVNCESCELLVTTSCELYIFFDLPLMQYLKFYHLAWMPSDGLENTNLVERRVNRTNGTNGKIDK